MKKSKIIIPALSLIAFSVAASVAGAVAWFTASRSAQISAGQYSVVKTSGELKATLTAGVGTAIDSTNQDTVLFNGYLTDGSFSHKKTTDVSEFITYPNSTGKAMGGTVDLADANATNLKRGVHADSKVIYTAATFDISFTVTFGSTGENVGLFIDNGSGKTQFTVKDNAEPVTAKGFRMAIVPKTIPNDSLGRATVIADLQTFAKCHYIGAKTDSALGGVDYVTTDYDLIDSQYATALPADGGIAKAGALERPDYLGFFKFAAGTQVTLTYTVVAWFEGTDENIVNQASNSLYQTVNAKLNFEAINLSD